MVKKSSKGSVMPDLEQRCIQPGHWMIEGFEVLRRRQTWNYYDEFGDRRSISYSLWAIEGENGNVDTFRTLTEAREHIATLKPFEHGGR
jgi:hypothetical protein